MSRPMPRQAVPDLSVPTLDGESWRLADRSPQNFTLVVFYRGLHCPICSKYLKDLDNKLEEFDKRGVEVIAVSADPQDRAEQSKKKWGLHNLKIGYGLDLDVARSWGLYISSGIGTSSTGDEELDYFPEPGLFLVRPDNTLYFGSIQTMPFARPQFAEVLQALDFVMANDYPARGEV